MKRKPKSDAPEEPLPKPDAKPELPDADIMLLEYCTYGSYPNPKRGYPQLWKYRFNITDVNSALQSLEERGYIEFCSALDMLPKFTIAQLKDIAAQNGVAVKGKKAEILSAVSAILPADLEQTVKERKYQLTDKGRKVLAANEHVVFAYKNPWTGVSVDELKALAAEEKDVSARDLIWAEFNRRCCYLPTVGAWNEYRQVRYSMYIFLRQENRHLFMTSHVFLAEVLYIDLNGYLPFVAPGLVSDIQEVTAAGDYSHEELFGYVRDFLSSLASAPPNNFPGVDVAGIYTALAFRLYDDACTVLSLCPEPVKDRFYVPSKTRARNLETGEWELVPEMTRADSLVHDVRYIAKFIAPA